MKLQNVTFSQDNVVDYLNNYTTHISNDIDIKRLCDELCEIDSDISTNIRVMFCQNNTAAPQLRVGIGNICSVDVSAIQLSAITIIPESDDVTYGSITLRRSIELLIKNNNDNMPLCLLPEYKCAQFYTSNAETCEELADDIYDAIISIVQSILEATIEKETTKNK